VPARAAAKGNPVMARHLLGIDHAVVAVRDLDLARAGFERLGFRLTPRGRHAGRGTGNHCIMFADDYVELVGIVDPSRPADDARRFLEEREGLMAIALGSDDLDATRAAWQEAGLEPAEVADFVRLMEPDTELRFQDVALPAEATAGVPMFACRPGTPSPMRRDDWLAHPNGARGIDSLTIVVDDPSACFAPMAAVFGGVNLTDTDDTLAVHTGRGVLLLVTPDDLDILHPELEAGVPGGGATIATLSLLVDDLDATAAWLEGQEIPFRRAGPTLGVRPHHAFGTMLEFTAAPRTTPWHAV